MLVRSTGQALNIIESGSNDNGNWIKYPNGIMICYGSIALGNVELTNAYGSVFINSGTFQINFSKTFTSIDSCVLTPIHFGGGVGGLSGGGYTMSGVKFYLWHSMAYTLPVTISYFVVGKWK